jgi:rod shape-determining protein MreC
MLKGVHQKLEPQESPAFFVRGPSPFSRMMFFCALSIVLMAIDARFSYLSQIRQAFIAALHPLEIVANAPSEMALNLKNYFTAHNTLVDENQKLKLQAVEHMVLLQRLKTIEAENAHLRSLLKGNEPIIPNSVLGEILHMGRDPFSNVIVINRGTTNKVKAGQAVVDANGVIGQVTRAFPFSAEVTLITDKNLSIPIQIERNQLRAIAFGEGKNNTLDIPYLPTSVDIKVGDKLVTSGIDGVYPAGLAVATVTEIRQNPDSPFAKIVSTPVAGVNNHLQLLILGMADPESKNNSKESETNSTSKKSKDQAAKKKVKSNASR